MASPLEAALAGLWAAALQVKTVHRDHNFLTLGGDSLGFTSLLTSVNALFGVSLKIELLSGDDATVAGMAQVIEADRRRAAPDEQRTHGPRGAVLQTAITPRQVRQVIDLSAAQRTESSPITRIPRQGNLPLSFAQQRLWLLDQLLPDKAAYNIPSAWRLQGPLDIPALERSLTALVARHETLRTRFVLSEGEPVQIIDRPHAVALPITDLSALPHRQHEANQRANAQAHEPFNLAAGPLLRAQLLRLGLAEHLLLLSVHHIASDGWSMGIFERELSAVYAAFVTGHPPQLPALPIQYADYAAWQRKWLQGEVLARQLAYWQTQLANLSTLELPTDRPRPPLASHHGGHLTCVLPEALTVALKALARRANATLFMTLLASFQVLLHRYSGQDDVAVGSPIAGRGRTELEGLIGFFVNTLVLRTDLSGNPPFHELLARVREHALGAYTHQDLPFEKLVEALAPARDLSRNPLFQVLFVLQNTPGAALALEGQIGRAHV